MRQQTSVTVKASP